MALIFLLAPETHEDQEKTALRASSHAASPEPLCETALQQMAQLASWPLGIVIQLSLSSKSQVVVFSGDKL